LSHPPAATRRPLLSVTEAAEEAGLSRSVAYSWARSGQLPGVVNLPGRRLRVRAAVLRAWLRGAEDER